MIICEFPFDINLSKNNTRAFARGHYYIKPEARKCKENLVMALKVACRGHKFNEAKLWVNIMVYKPNNRIDAGNFVDTIFDAIQEVSGINDKWYSISQLDWELEKENPRIIIKLEQ